MNYPELKKIELLDAQIKALEAERDKARQKAVEAMCPYKPGVEIKIQHGPAKSGEVMGAAYHKGWGGTHQARITVRLRKKDGSLGEAVTDRFVSIDGNSDWDKQHHPIIKV